MSYWRGKLRSRIFIVSTLSLVTGLRNLLSTFLFFKEAHEQTAMGKSELVSSEAGNQMGLEILAIKGRQGGRGCTCLIMDGLLFCLCMSRYRLKTSSLCCLPDTLISF
jgi:hypothetical protein